MFLSRLLQLNIALLLNISWRESSCQEWAEQNNTLGTNDFTRNVYKVSIYVNKSGRKYYFFEENIKITEDFAFVKVGGI